MTHYDETKDYLERMPKARERKFKNKFLASLMNRKYGPEMQTGVTDDIIERLIVAAASYDRAWRQVLQHEEHLRGKDYDEKQIVEETKELELGYVPGIERDIKKVEKIAPKPYPDK